MEGATPATNNAVPASSSASEVQAENAKFETANRK
jgi:hypothetical protein